MVRPSSRGGVPVFSRPSANPSAFQRRGKAQRRRFADPAGRGLLLADVDQAAQERAGGQDHGAGGEFAAIGQADTGHAAIVDRQIVGLAFDHRQIRRFRGSRACMAAA